MKIAWYSNPPWSSSGYGVQTKLITPRLRDAGHEVAIIANCGLQYGVLNFDGIPVFPHAPNGSDPHTVRHQLAQFGADVTISFYDAWCLTPDWFPPAWVPWFPVDREPGLPIHVKKAIEGAAWRIACSRSGQTVTTQAGIDCGYAPCAIDTNVYKPMPRTDAREQLNLPADAWIVGIVADNKSAPSRKALPQQLQAFAEFHKSHPDAVLMLHTCMSPIRGGYDLGALVEYLGIKGAIRVTEQHAYHAGMPEEYMRALYSSLDVLLGCSMDEGFGVPLVEAQACGVPVIAGDWTAMPDQVRTGWLVPRSESEPWYMPPAGEQRLPRVGAIAHALELAYGARSNDPADVAAKVADYDIAAVMTNHWMPCIETIQGVLKNGAERKQDAA